MFHFTYYMRELLNVCCLVFSILWTLPCPTNLAHRDPNIRILLLQFLFIFLSTVEWCSPLCYEMYSKKDLLWLYYTVFPLQQVEPTLTWSQLIYITYSSLLWYQYRFHFLFFLLGKKTSILFNSFFDQVYLSNKFYSKLHWYPFF